MDNTARLDRTATEDWKCLCVVAVAGVYPGRFELMRARTCSGGDVLIQPVEDALAADAIGGWLAVRVRAFFLGEPDQRLSGWQLVAQPTGLSWPELLIVGVGDQHRADDLPDHLVGQRVRAGRGEN